MRISNEPLSETSSKRSQTNIRIYVVLRTIKAVAKV